jgi:molybdate transport system permease protein
MLYDFQPLLLSLKLALITALLLLVIGVPIAYWLSSVRFRLKFLIEALVNLPLVLPPTVLGFYFLLTFSPQHPAGRLVHQIFGGNLVFTFTGLVVGSLLINFPYMIQPVQAGFQSLPPSLKEASYTLGKSRLTTFFKVLLPNVKPALLSGLVLTFAHTIGEFGIVLMIGGNIPGVTKVASISVYEEVELLHYGQAGFYALVLLLVSFLILAVFYALNGKFMK